MESRFNPWRMRTLAPGMQDPSNSLGGKNNLEISIGRGWGLAIHLWCKTDKGPDAGPKASVAILRTG